MKCGTALLLALISLGPTANAEPFAAEGTVFAYTVVVKENDEDVLRDRTEIAILSVTDGVAFFSECELGTGSCAVGYTDGISVGYFDFYDLGDSVPTRLLAEFRANPHDGFPYPPGRFFPLEDAKRVSWSSDDGSVAGVFTQSCCVQSEDRTLWVMEFEETYNGGWPTRHTRHFDPELGWHVWERIEIEFATMPTSVVELRLTGVTLPN